MFTRGKKDGTIRFCFQSPSGAQKVHVAGSFSQWKPLAMRKQTDGAFATNVTLKPGSYEYKFIVDGQWTVDADNGAFALNPYGTVNSVAVVK